MFEDKAVLILAFVNPEEYSTDLAYQQQDAQQGGDDLQTAL